MNHIELKVGLRGRFKIEAVRPDGTRRLLAPWQDNLITDSGMDSVGSGRLNIQKCHVGSGSTPPTFADTALQTEVAVTTTGISTTTSASSSSPYYTATTLTFRFATGVAAGNLSELGMGDTSGPLFSRALIKDSFGSPTTITVLSDEQLDVSYEFRRYQTDTDWTGTVVISAVSYAVIVRAAYITAVSAFVVNSFFEAWTFTPSNLDMFSAATDIGSITTGPASSGFSGQVRFNHSIAYTPGTYYRDTVYFADLGDGNMPYGANFMLASQGVAQWQVKFTPDIPKDGTKTLTLTFRLAWARYTP